MNLDPLGMDQLSVEGKRVLMRVDFNVPLREGVITDDTRIRAAVPSVRALLERGARPVLLSHFGRPKGEVVDALRLDPIAKRLEELLGSRVLKLNESIGPDVEAAVSTAPTGTVVLLENVRFHPGETKGDPELSAAFARLGDVFVNDAFGTSHRDHSSVSGLGRALPSAAGLLLQVELDAFRKVLEGPARPLVAILGGAKVSDKLGVINHLLDKVNAILIGGGMAYTFLKSRGEPVGNSLVQEDRLDDVRACTSKAEKLGVQLLLPVDHVVGDRFAEDAVASTVDAIPDGTLALDIGPKSRAAYVETIRSAGTVLWNGPMGVFEWEAFRGGTEAVGRAVAECPGYTVVGGGDSVAAIGLLGLGSQIGHISTGGGASLELLEGRELPGIAALGGSVG